MKVAIIIAATIALGGCVALPPSVAPVRSDGFARIGEAARIGPFVVTPLAVVEDSRCPINARCIWAGRLIVKTRIDGAGWRNTANLTMGEVYRTHGTGLALVSGEPGRVAGASPAPPASLFGFEPRP